MLNVYLVTAILPLISTSHLKASVSTLLKSLNFSTCIFPSFVVSFSLLFTPHLSSFHILSHILHHSFSIIVCSSLLLLLNTTMLANLIQIIFVLYDTRQTCMILLIQDIICYFSVTLQRENDYLGYTYIFCHNENQIKLRGMTQHTNYYIIVTSNSAC